MKYNYKTNLNYQNIQEALSDFDSLNSGRTIHLKQINEWLRLYSDLQETCLKDRYFNSCVSGFPCIHTNDNIEYNFSMFYYSIKDFDKWKDLNSKCEPYIEKVLLSTPDTVGEDDAFAEVVDDIKYNLIDTCEFKIDQKGDSISVVLKHFDYGEVKINKREVDHLYILSSLYDKWLCRN